ncbi:MAG: universal stress protein [Steroidobacteraceae bacterium]
MYKRILLAVDDDAASDAVALEAERMARTGGARIKVLHVAQEPIDTMSYAASSRSIGARVAAGERLLARIGERLRSDGIDHERQLSEIIGIAVAQEIVRQADDWRADLIVMGTHGRRGLSRLLVGSTAAGVVRTSAMPVLLVRNDHAAANRADDAGYGRLLVPVDNSKPSLAGLEQALIYARETGAAIKAVHVLNLLAPDASAVPSVGYEPFLLNARKKGHEVLAAARDVADERAVAIETEMLEVVGGNTTQPILETALLWEADLIVMGTHGRRGIPRLAMGSDAEDVLRASPVPVLLTRQDEEFISLVADSSKLQPLELQ